MTILKVTSDNVLFKGADIAAIKIQSDLIEKGFLNSFPQPLNWSIVGYTSYTKVYSIPVLFLPPAAGVTIDFTLFEQSGSDAVYGTIYRNGLAVGTERSIVGNTANNWVQTLSFYFGDTIEIWCKTASTMTSTISNVKIYV